MNAPVDRPIAPGTRIGHVHLKVADLDRAIGFYVGVLGFGLKQKYGNEAAFVAALVRWLGSMRRWRISGRRTRTIACGWSPAAFSSRNRASC